MNVSVGDYVVFTGFVQPASDDAKKRVKLNHSYEVIQLLSDNSVLVKCENGETLSLFDNEYAIVGLNLPEWF